MFVIRIHVSLVRQRVAFLCHRFAYPAVPRRASIDSLSRSNIPDALVYHKPMVLARTLAKTHYPTLVAP